MQLFPMKIIAVYAQSFTRHTIVKWNWIESIRAQILPNNRDVKDDTILFSPLIISQL